MANKNEVNGDSSMEQRIAELQNEKDMLSQNAKSCPNALRLLSEEIEKLQGKPGGREIPKYSDIVKDRPTKVTVKVLIPTKEYPSFNFVGKLLGPKGNSMKRLQEETMTRMAVKGEGSMRDKVKEDELRAGGDPKYGHLHEELHVEISAMAPVAEAYARVAHSLAEIRKFLIPDNNDDIAQEQMMEMEMMAGGRPGNMGRGAQTRGGANRGYRGGAGGGGRALLATPPPSLATHSQTRPPTLPPPSMSVGRGVSRPPVPSQRALSILSKARQSMDDSYHPYDSYSGYDNYNENVGGGGGYDSYGSYSDTWPSNRSRRYRF